MSRLFEIGHVYPPGDGELPDEFEQLAVVLAGRDAMAAMRRVARGGRGDGLRRASRPVEATGGPASDAVSNAVARPRRRSASWGRCTPTCSTRTASTSGSPSSSSNLSVLLATKRRSPMWKPTSRFPSSDLDLAFTTPDSVTAEKVEKAIKQAAGPLLVDLALFDVYRGAGLPPDSRSLAYRLRLQALDRTLGDAELTELRNKVVAGVGKLGATLTRLSRSSSPVATTKPVHRW